MADLRISLDRDGFGREAADGLVEIGDAFEFAQILGAQLGLQERNDHGPDLGGLAVLEQLDVVVGERAEGLPQADRRRQDPGRLDERSEITDRLVESIKGVGQHAPEEHDIRPAIVRVGREDTPEFNQALFCEELIQVLFGGLGAEMRGAPGQREPDREPKGQHATDTAAGGVDAFHLPFQPPLENRTHKGQIIASGKKRLEPRRLAPLLTRCPFFIMRAEENIVNAAARDASDTTERHLPDGTSPDYPPAVP